MRATVPRSTAGATSAVLRAGGRAQCRNGRPIGRRSERGQLRIHAGYANVAAAEENPDLSTVTAIAADRELNVVIIACTQRERATATLAHLRHESTLCCVARLRWARFPSLLGQASNQALPHLRRASPHHEGADTEPWGNQTANDPCVRARRKIVDEALWQSTHGYFGTGHERRQGQHADELHGHHFPTALLCR